MKTYCVRQRKNTDCVPGTERIKIAKNGRQMLVCKCAECGITKTRFASVSTNRMKLISDRTKKNAAIKKLANEIPHRGNKMTAAEKAEIGRKIAKLKTEKQKTISDLYDVDRTLSFARLNRDIKKTEKNLSRPDLDKKFNRLMLDLDYEKAKRKDLSRPDLDKKYAKLMKEWDAMTKKTEREIIRHFRHPDQEKNYRIIETVIDKQT